MLADIKYLFIGLFIGATISIIFAILTRCIAMLNKRFPSSFLSKLSNLLSTKYEISIYPIFTAKFLPAWLTVLAAVISGVTGLGASLSALTPFIFIIIGLVIGLVAAIYVLEIFKEIKNT